MLLWMSRLLDSVWLQVVTLSKCHFTPMHALLVTLVSAEAALPLIGTVFSLFFLTFFHFSPWYLTCFRKTLHRIRSEEQKDFKE
jgi:hypothetical protein